METEQLIYLSCFSIGIIAAILLIHGAFQVDFLSLTFPVKFLTNCLSQLNRFLLIYWLVVAGWRIVMQLLLLLEIFFLHILDNSQYELLYTFLEVLDFGKPLPQHTSFKNNVPVSFQ